MRNYEKLSILYIRVFFSSLVFAFLGTTQFLYLDKNFVNLFHYKYSSLRTFQVAQMVKNLPEIQATWVQSLGRDPLEKEMVTHSSVLAWKIPRREAWQATVHGVTKQSDMTEQLTFIFTVSKFTGGIGHDSYFSSLYVKISKPTTLDMQAI